MGQGLSGRAQEKAISLGRVAGMGTVDSYPDWTRQHAHTYFEREGDRDRRSGWRSDRDIRSVGYRRDSNRPSSCDGLTVPGIFARTLDARLVFRAVYLLECIDAAAYWSFPVVVLVPEAPQLLISILGVVVILLWLDSPTFRRERERMGHPG